MTQFLPFLIEKGDYLRQFSKFGKWFTAILVIFDALKIWISLSCSDLKGWHNGRLIYLPSNRDEQKYLLYVY